MSKEKEFIQMCQNAKEVILKNKELKVSLNVYNHMHNRLEVEECSHCKIDDNASDCDKHIIFCDNHLHAVNVTALVPPLKLD